MVPLSSLWLPILLSAVLVFVASSIVHMVLGLHRSDYGKLANEDAVLEALRGAGVAPGTYTFPCAANPKDMSTPEMLEKYKKGPVGILNVIPSGPPAMPKLLGQWFAFSVLVGVFAAYLAGRALGPGAHYLAVFRVVGTVAFLAYLSTHATDPIWKGERWGIALKHAADGFVYALLTAGVFGWLWP
ncbi:MAG TPA: hypothetical protein VFM88_18620 [Vicinamibacteria bacterium]|nr:hypothetical protein [Vicinamibacteria bacterium]